MHSTRRALVAAIVAVCLTLPTPPTVAVAQTSPAPASTVSVTSLLQGAVDQLHALTWPLIAQALPAAIAAQQAGIGPRPLPADLDPGLKKPKAVKPRSYSDGCHLQPGETTVKTCIYGDPQGTKSVVLFGDSHAAMWLPALDSIAARRGWQLYSITKSGCPVALVPADVPGHSTPDCDTWRENAQAFIAGIHPDLVITASVERQGTPGQPTNEAWDAGMLTSLASLVGGAKRVVALGETPQFPTAVPGCLRQHQDDTRACDSPRDFALSPPREAADAATAIAAGAEYVPVDDITCPDSPCPSVIGHYMVTYDVQHMSPAFVMSLIPELEARLPTP